MIKSHRIKFLRTGSHVEEQLDLVKNEPASVTGCHEKTDERQSGLRESNFFARKNGAETWKRELVDHQTPPCFGTVSRRMNEVEHLIFERTALRVGRDRCPRDD